MREYSLGGDLLIKNAKIPHPTGYTYSDILIQDGIITKLARSISAHVPMLDVSGNLAIPGVVDVHVHFRDLEQAHKEDWFSGSLAAAAGGVSCVVDQPNTQPPILDPASFQLKLARASSNSVVDFCLNVWFSNRQNLEKLLQLGAAGLGELLMYQLSSEQLQQIFSAAASWDLVVSVHPEDRDFSELNAIKQLIQLNSRYGLSKLHLAHLSLGSSLKLALAHGLSFELSLPHLMLSNQAGFPLRPPLRSRYQQQLLWRNLDKIGIISSDHAPHLESEIAAGARGIPGVQEMLPLLCYQLKQGKIALNDLVDKLCSNPARLYGIPGKGKLAPGAQGDLVILDLTKVEKLTPSRILSKSGWSAYLGKKMIFPRITIIRGHIVYRDGELQVSRGFGRFIPVPHARIPRSSGDNPSILSELPGLRARSARPIRSAAWEL